MEDRIIELEKKLIKIENKLDNIYNLLNTDVKDNCEKMKEHIDFIDNVYDSIKFPLYFICNRINYNQDNVPIKSIADKSEIPVITDKSEIPVINIKKNIEYVKKKNIKKNEFPPVPYLIVGTSLLFGYITYRYINRKII